MEKQWWVTKFPNEVFEDEPSNGMKNVGIHFWSCFIIRIPIRLFVWTSLSNVSRRSTDQWLNISTASTILFGDGTMDITEESPAITCPSCRISIVPSRARTMCPFCGSFYNRAANNDVSLRRRSTDEPVRLPQLVENVNVSCLSFPFSRNKN